MKALLAIDIQRGLTDRKLFQKELFLEAVNNAIDEYRKNGDAIIFVQHENKQLVKGTDDWLLDERLHSEAGDKYFGKTNADAFSVKELRDFLDSNEIKDVLVCGLVSHGCISYTVKGGLGLGYDMSLLKNGHTNWNKDAAVKISSAEKTLSDLGAGIIEY